MLFNSYLFILLFLPFTLFHFSRSRNRDQRAGICTAGLLRMWGVQTLFLLLILMAANSTIFRTAARPHQVTIA
jgi:hypothetical protein